MKKIVLFFVLFIISGYLFAQKTIVTIGNTNISTEQYEQIYIKNNSQLFDESQKKTPEEYMELFIDYKLKVLEAEKLGMDTLSEFTDELKGYRDELAKQYLTDITITDEMIEEVYFRTINEIKASHILLSLPQDASPVDTLKSYNKAIDIRNKFVNGENTFEELALEHSDDPSVQRNQGDLGYFKAFNMIVDFENAAYNTPVGEVSMPVRTEFGYHLIHVTDIYESEGEVHIAHIMKMFNAGNTSNQNHLELLKAEIDSIYDELKRGAEWNELVIKHSDDANSANRNGDMNWISKTFTVPEFVEAAFSIENIGDISEPVRTTFGWHIIKLLDTRQPRTFEEMKEELTLRLKRDPQRSYHSKQKFINNLKSKHQFTAHQENIETLKDFFKKQGKLVKLPLPENISDLSLYSINKQNFTITHFLEAYNLHRQSSIQTDNILTNFEDFEDEVLILYQDSMLEKENPEFAQTIQEYRDGMLLFSIMQKKVWDKAVTDSVGLQNHYESNKNKYTWAEHFDGLLIHALNDEAFAQCKNLLEQGVVNPDTLLTKINTDKTNIRIRKGKWEKGDNEKVDHLVFNEAKPSHFNAQHEFVHGNVVKAGTPKTLDEARGFYISDYQKILEDEWMESLRNKYKIKVNNRQLRRIQSL